MAGLLHFPAGIQAVLCRGGSGGAERDKLEARRKNLSSQLGDLYDSTATYRDGKWLQIGVSTADDLRDLTELLTIKRPPAHAIEGPIPARVSSFRYGR
ncbi:DUF3788 family protein [Rhizobium mesosinicum]|uniref:DUF3788 family protein n=1 Tax=Rhizobium mesosinicum TaxID=335017 RepID=UPI0030842B54